MDKNEIPCRTRVEREWWREKGQETSSHKQKPKFLEVENATSEKLDFFFSKKNMLLPDSSEKPLLLRSKKKASKIFWMDRFHVFFLVPVTPTSGSRPTAGSWGHWIARLPPFNKVLRTQRNTPASNSRAAFHCGVTRYNSNFC